MNEQTQIEPGFFVIPFGIDGESLGTGFWPLSKLSPHWLEFCRKYLTTGGPSFDALLPDNLSRIRVKYSSASGAALLSIFVGGRLVSSIIILSGRFPTADADAAQMFVASLRRAAPVKSAVQSMEPFADLLQATERPLMGVVHWLDDNVDGEADELVRELGLHFAGAFAMGTAGPA
jgi:hypothetical protein